MTKTKVAEEPTAEEAVPTRRLELIMRTPNGWYQWSGHDKRRSDVISVVIAGMFDNEPPADARLMDTKKLAKAAATYFPDMSKEARNELLDATGLLDRYHGTMAEVKVIQAFGKKHGIEVAIAE
jgi:hypothetical protein